MINEKTLCACGVRPSIAGQYAAHLAKAAERFHINTGPRVAAFIAQAMHESANFERVEENLYYTTPDRVLAMFPSKVRNIADAATLIRNPRALANRVYANRLGNGDESSGDGWMYRGRGFFQLTGRANYMAADEALGRPYKVKPELVAQSADAAMTSAWFWAVNHLNELIDAGKFDETTRRINGPARAGAHDRAKKFAKCLEVFT